MGGTGVIDNFLGIFTSYIDSGFGLLGGEVAFIATTLIVIDVTLAALFWAWGADDDIIARLVKKTLFVGVFAYIISNWNNLARIVFESFAGLGLMASGTGFSAADLLRPGRVAQTGLEAGRPLLESISDLMGWVAVFENLVQILCLFFAWALVILAFFILAIQLFITIIEFKLTTLAGFVLVPFLRRAIAATLRPAFLNLPRLVVLLLVRLFVRVPTAPVPVRPPGPLLVDEPAVAVHVPAPAGAPDVNRRGAC